MRIARIGVGAMGSVCVGLLADAGGHEIIAVDSWADHVAAIKRNGLRVEGASGDRTGRLQATTNRVDVRDADLVIIATKNDWAEAAAQAALNTARGDWCVRTERLVPPHVVQECRRLLSRQVV